MSRTADKNPPAAAIDESDESPPPKRRRWPLVVIVIAVVSCVVGVVVYMQDRELHQAEAALDRDEPRLARYLAEEFIKRHPNHSRAHTLLARTLVKARQDPEKAVAIFNQYRAATSDEAHAWAQAHLMLDQYAHAVPLLEQVIELEPTNDDALYELSTSLMRLGQPKDAIRPAQMLINSEKSQANGFLLMALIHSDLTQYNKSVEFYEKLNELRPDGKDLPIPPQTFFLQFGKTLLTIGDADRARKMVLRSIKIEKTADAYVTLGSALLLSSDENAEELADTAWASCLMLDPMNQKAREALANLSLQRGKPHEALKLLKRLEDSPRLEATTAYMIERSYRALDEEEMADKWAKKTAELRKMEQIMGQVDSVIRQAPNSYWAHVLRARDFASRENWSQADLLLTLISEKTAPEEDFTKQLIEAVRNRSVKDLPPLDELPLELN